MAIDIRFPVEFVVAGTPVSLQNKGRKSLRAWQARVREATLGALPDSHFASDSAVAVALYYFPAVAMPGDIDNIVKPILDALEKHIYRNDHQVERVLVQKFEPDRVFKFSRPSAVLAAALSQPKPNLYIRLSDDPFEDLT